MEITKYNSNICKIRGHNTIKRKTIYKSKHNCVPQYASVNIMYVQLNLDKKTLYIQVYMYLINVVISGLFCLLTSYI